MSNTTSNAKHEETIARLTRELAEVRAGMERANEVDSDLIRRLYAEVAGYMDRVAGLTAERDAALAENATLRKATKEYFDAREAFDASGSEESERRLECAHEALRSLA